MASHIETQNRLVVKERERKLTQVMYSDKWREKFEYKV